MLRFILISSVYLYGVCFFGLSWAEEAPILKVNHAIHRLNLSNYLSWLKDSNHDLRIQDVIHPENGVTFQSAQGKTLNFGFSSAAYWLKIQLQGDALKRSGLWYIHLRYPLLNQIDLYVFQNNKLEHLTTGTKYPFSSRPLKHPDFVFPIHIQPNDEITVYFNIKSSSSIQFPMTFWESSDFYAHEIPLFMGIGGLYAFFIFVSIFNLILFFMFRYRTFLIYAFFIFTYVLFHMSYKGIAMTWLWPQWNTWGILSVPFFVTLTSVGSLLFTQYFLNIKTCLPKLTIAFQSIIIFSLFSLILPFSIPYGFAIRISIVIALANSLLILMTIIYCIYRGLSQANFFLIAWLTVFTGILTYILKTIGILPSTFLIEKSIEIGYFLCIAMLGLSLCEQFQRERTQQKKIHTQSILDRKHRIKIQETTITMLDQKTKELHNISSNLSQQIDQLNMESDTVAGASEEMSANIETIASSVEELSVNIKGISSSSEKMSHHNTSVAGAIQELTASMNQITNHAQKGSDIAAQVVAMADAAGQTMKSLGSAADQIGSVTEVIKRIAEKTDILAVNAAIEAASAGEAGKGFAVVANEITKFSDQSAGAAEDIAKRIGGVQNQTQKAIEGIAKMQAVIESMNHSSESISMAVEQQTM
ncbi:MAG: hypothetical protein HQK75_11300, partial [Candidatus Magnetomorum sp.]|nr:hypothetical protein [Candidatus Magnetomorum sp.]